jgi:hypothetical protein
LFACCIKESDRYESAQISDQFFGIDTIGAIKIIGTPTDPVYKEIKSLAKLLCQHIEHSRKIIAIARKVHADIRLPLIPQRDRISE